MIKSDFGIGSVTVCQRIYRLAWRVTKNEREMLITRASGLVLIAIALSGCAVLRDGLSAAWPKTDVESEPAMIAADPIAPAIGNLYTLASEQQSVVGQVQVMRANDQDTFADIARTYGLGFDELLSANPDVDPWLPGEGTLIVLPTQFVIPDVPREGLVLNIANKRLFFFAPIKADETTQQLYTFPIGIGRVGWETPTGSASVIAKARDPAWYVPASVRKEHREAGDPLPAIVPPGPDNPLGRHVLKLDMPGYLIHGTNQPYGVGMRVSHGCVRLYPEDIERLYAMVPRGMSVRIVNTPVSFGWHENVLYMDAHARLEDDSREADALFVEVVESLRGRHGVFDDTFSEDDLRRAMDQASGISIAIAGALDATTSTPVLVHNVTTAPEDSPSREEVSAMIEAIMSEADETAPAEPDS